MCTKILKTIQGSMQVFDKKYCNFIKYLYQSFNVQIFIFSLLPSTHHSNTWKSHESRKYFLTFNSWLMMYCSFPYKRNFRIWWKQSETFWKALKLMWKIMAWLKYVVIHFDTTSLLIKSLMDWIYMYLNLIENDRWCQIYQIKNESSERKRVDPTCITFYQIKFTVLRRMSTY